MKVDDEIIPLEQFVAAHFGLSLKPSHVVARRLPVGRLAWATIFTSPKRQLYVLIDSQTQRQLADVKKIITHMGLTAELYIPPKGRPHYFSDYGIKKFQEIFPGRAHVSEADIRFYRTLAPYNPALVLIREVKKSIIYQYDSDAKATWRPSIKLSYRRITAQVANENVN